MRDPTPGDFWAHLDKVKPSGHSVLVINDVDSEWGEDLCTRFPKAIDRTFILEHILGFAWLKGCYALRAKHGDLERNVVADLERLKQALPFLFEGQRAPGKHIDCYVEAKNPKPQSRSFGDFYFVLAVSGWVKSNRFLSYCQLKDNFCK